MRLHISGSAKMREASQSSVDPPVMGVEEVRRDTVARKKCVAFRSSGRGVTRKTRRIKPAATLQSIRDTSPMNSAMRVAAQSVRERRAADTIAGVR
jgi:hypothetical protein